MLLDLYYPDQFGAYIEYLGSSNLDFKIEGVDKLKAYLKRMSVNVDEVQTGPISDVFENAGINNTQFIATGSNIFLMITQAILSLVIYIFYYCGYIREPTILEGEPPKNWWT
jgi:hypothetical protein